MDHDSVKPKERIFFTCGYQHLSISRFVRLLRENRVSLVVDVRQNPVSRKPGFSKSTLDKRLSVEGVAYFHFPCLGNPLRIRRAFCRHGMIARALREYEEYLETRRGCLQGMVKKVENSLFCLLCLEEDYNRCHRSVVARKLGEMTGWRPTHLTAGSK